MIERKIVETLIITNGFLTIKVTRQEALALMNDLVMYFDEYPVENGDFKSLKETTDATNDEQYITTNNVIAQQEPYMDGTVTVEN